MSRIYFLKKLIANQKFKKMGDDKSLKITIVIDVFRAFTTACYVLDMAPKKYIYTNKSAVLKKLAYDYRDALFIGKNEIGANIVYDISNSPTRVVEQNIKDRIIMHRTEAGSRGILEEKVDIILAASFVNAEATAAFVKKFPDAKVTIKPMGHEAHTPTLEDDLCAQHIRSLLMGAAPVFDFKPFLQKLKKGSGQYFFSNDQWQYPKEDFLKCLELNRFNFAIQATLFGDFALLTRCNEAT